jgi:hypothetical protein
MKPYYLLFVCFLITASSIPTSAYGYRLTAASATAITADTTLYTITFRMGFLNREVSIPIMAEQGSSTRTRAVSFALRQADGSPVTAPRVEAMVLSQAAIKDGSYYLPEGKNADFTLVALVRGLLEPGNTRLEITGLPFTLIDGNRRTDANAPSGYLPALRTPIPTDTTNTLLVK